MRKLSSLCLVPALICMLAGRGLGQETKPETERTWYGKQILVTDTISLLAVTAAFVGKDDRMLGVAAGMFLFPPILAHGAHHHGGRAIASVLIRAPIPLMTAVVGGYLANCHRSERDEHSSCRYRPVVAGLGVGMIVASIMDLSGAWDTRVSAQPAPYSPPTSRRREGLINFTTAGIVPTSDGPRVMIGGRF